MRRSDAGFTLLEVMAAVAIVAIVFTTLARVANQGVESEGASKRRLEASLLADRVLADIEAELATGTAPEVGQSEFEEGNFDVLVDVTAFDLEGLIPESAGTAAENTSSARSTSPAAGPSPVASAVRAIEIAVTWPEPQGGKELRVTRNSYAFDLASVEELLQASGGGLAPDLNAGNLAR